jgi:hypothetical protein
MDKLFEAINGKRIYFILRHRSRSGMKRSVSLAVVDGDDLRVIDHLVASAGIGKFDPKHGGIVVHGAGMDAGALLVRQIEHCTDARVLAYGLV